MLLQLTIRDYAVARSLDAEWHAGMTVITGETGAGKSILLDALGLALGWMLWQPVPPPPRRV